MVFSCDGQIYKKVYRIKTLKQCFDMKKILNKSIDFKLSEKERIVAIKFADKDNQ